MAEAKEAVETESVEDKISATERITIMLPKQDARILTAICEAEEMPRNEVVRRLIRRTFTYVDSGKPTHFSSETHHFTFLWKDIAEVLGMTVDKARSAAAMKWFDPTNLGSIVKLAIRNAKEEADRARVLAELTQLPTEKNAK